jgi:signal transduction histidine kinase/CheY-like chemotaxis protein
MSPALNLVRAAPAWMRVLLAVQALCACLYALLLLDGADGAGMDPGSWWPIGVLALVSALSCVVRGLSAREERLAWWLLGVGIACWGAGFLLWAALYENDATPPEVSSADVPWLAFMVLFVAALAALVRAERPRIAPVAWLDALIPAFAVSAVTTQLLLPSIETAGKPVADQVALIAYPALDILLIVVAVLVLAIRGWEPGPRWGLLAVALVGSVAGDVFWTYLIADGTYSAGAVADLPYLITSVAVGWAAWVPKGKELVRREDDRLTLILPTVAAGCALGLLFYGGITADLIFPALALAVAAVSAGVVRWWLALRREAQAGVLRDVAAELARKADQQEAVADLGRRAIATGDVEELMVRATEVVGAILDARRVAVFELGLGVKELALRAQSGTGDERDDSWGDPTLNEVALETLDAGTPTALVHGGLGARIERKDGSWGVIVVLQGGERDFGDDDVNFVQAVANVLSAVVARAREEQLESQLQQSRRLESVGKLAGGVAHDFNNLLAIILNYADFALEAATDEEQRRDLEELSKAASRGAELVRQLLLFSRRKPVDAVTLDVAEVVRDTEPMLRRAVGEHIDLRCWLVSELPPTVIDPGQITQVLLNLAVNARDAMPDGGQLTIKGTPIDGGVRLVVEDTGFGMDEETVAKAFDPFFTTKEPGSGTGLGLATVYGIVTQANGTISLESAPGHGTRVVIDLPSTNAVPTPWRKQDSPVRERGSGRGETILVVEDDAQVRGVAGRILRDHGYRVLEASGGEAALSLAADDPIGIDLLVSDVVMPEMNGPELAERLREARPSLRVLHMSGYTSGIGGPDPRLTLPELIEKPFTADELVAHVRKLLSEPKLSSAS